MLSSFGTAKPQLSAVRGLDCISVPILKNLYQYWLEKRGHRQMPSRTDIIPTDIVSLLPNIVLIDVEHAPLRFKFRLIGTEVVQGMGQEFTGKYLDELPFCSDTCVRFKWLVENQETYFIRTQLDRQNRNFQKYSVLSMPLGCEDKMVNMIMCGIDPFYEK